MNKSSLKTIEVLEFIAASPKAVGISEISRALGYPKSSVFDIVSVLRNKGYIEQDSSELKNYSIGLRAYQIGTEYIRRADLYQSAHEVLVDISNRTGETAFLAMERDGKIVYLDKVESDNPIRTSCNIGSANYMHLTGLGKAILAAYPDEKIKAITQDKFVIRTNQTITNYEELMVEINKIRGRGYSFDNGEDNEMIRCIAAPIRNADGNVVAAISISMLLSRFTPKKVADGIGIITSSAIEISRRLGYTGEVLYPNYEKRF